MRSYFVLFLMLAACAGVWVYFQHPEYVAQLTSPESQKKLEAAVSEVETTAQKTFAGNKEEAPKPKPFAPPNPIPKQDDWTWMTTTGNIYHNVRIVKVEADCVTILHADGGARIDTDTLPPDIQRQLNYNPDIAQYAATQRSSEMDYTKQQLSAEAAQIKADSMAVATALSWSPPASTDPNGPMKFRIDALQAKYDEYKAKAASARAASSSGSSTIADQYDDWCTKIRSEIQHLKTQLANSSPPPPPPPTPATTSGK